MTTNPLLLALSWLGIVFIIIFIVTFIVNRISSAGSNTYRIWNHAESVSDTFGPFFTKLLLVALIVSLLASVVSSSIIWSYIKPYDIDLRPNGKYCYIVTLYGPDEDHTYYDRPAVIEKKGSTLYVTEVFLSPGEFIKYRSAIFRSNQKDRKTYGELGETYLYDSKDNEYTCIVYDQSFYFSLYKDSYNVTTTNYITTITQIVSAIISILIVAIAIFTQPNKSKLYELVSWICSKDSSQRRCGIPLVYKLVNLKNNKDVEENYRISLDDESKKFIEEILDQYQNELAQAYFTDKLNISREICRMTPSQYLILSLNIFLAKHELDSSFFGRETHTIIHSEGSLMPMDSYYAKYKLNDFSILYHKLQYITTKLNPSKVAEEWERNRELERLKKNIDDGIMEVSAIS